MIDPRASGIRKRLKPVGRVVAVTGGKGGIGKSMVATTLALTLSRKGSRVGLLDLDFTGPCDHVILGVTPRVPSEEFGIEPPVVDGIAFMTVAHFSGDRPSPMRGVDMTNALLEILAVTRWPEIDVLVVDMPPGLSDATLDAVRLLKGTEYLMVTTASRIVLETVRRTLRFHQEAGSRVLGLVENMSRRSTAAVEELARDSGVPLLGRIPFDETVEGGVGDPAGIVETPFGRSVAMLPIP